MADKYIWIDVVGPIRETDKAMLFETEQGEIWIPKSHMGAHKESDGPTWGVVATPSETTHWSRLEVTRWIAEQKGLVEAEDPKDEW